jgi:PAS domain S-box-containing protein
MPDLRALVQFPGIRPAFLLMGAVTVALVVIFSITGRSLDQFDRATRTMLQAERLLSTFRDAEIGQRGFLLTGDPTYLEPYHKALRRIDGDFENLTALLANDPSAGERLNRLRTLARTKLDIIAETIALHQDHDLGAALAIVRGGLGKQTMDAMRSEIADLQKVVAVTIGQAQAQQRMVIGVAETVALAASILACISLGAAAWLLVRRSDALLRRTAERQKLAVEAAALGTWFWDIEHDELTWSDRRKALFGLPPEAEVTYDSFLSSLHPDDRMRTDAAVRRSLLDGMPYRVEYRAVWPDGSIHWLHVLGATYRNSENKSSRMDGVIYDITEAKAAEQRMRELQAELLHATRLSTLGEMAGILAHEINQPLSAAVNYLDGSTALIGSNQPGAIEMAVAGLAKARRQEERAGDIVQRLSRFIRTGAAERQTADVNSLVQEAAVLALAGADRLGVRVTWALAPDLPAVSVDRIQIQQVVVNLVRNALEAMATMPRRDLTIATAADEMVTLSVADSGPGLTADSVADLFTPFVTTKPGGLGLGLSICRSIVVEHGGGIRTEPNTGGGAVFHVSLPTMASVGETSHAA